MNLNATLLGQMLTFTLLVWVTMKYIWPPILHALEERQEKIAAGLKAAEQGKLELERAMQKTEEQLSATKQQVEVLLKQASEQAGHIIDEAKIKAQQESNRIVALAQVEIQQNTQKAKSQLFKEAVDIAIACAEQILQKKITIDSDMTLLGKFITDEI